MNETGVQEIWTTSKVMCVFMMDKEQGWRKEERGRDRKMMISTVN